jgi:hypothetical protein
VKVSAFEWLSGVSLLWTVISLWVWRHRGITTNDAEALIGSYIIAGGLGVLALTLID